MTEKETLTTLEEQRNQWKELALAENLTDFAKDRIAE